MDYKNKLSKEQKMKHMGIKQNKAIIQKILILFIILIISGCDNSITNKKSHTTTDNMYEVVLSTKDTVYVEAYQYSTYAGFFGGSSTVKYTFYNYHHQVIQEIINPMSIKKIKGKGEI